ncbi:MAG TPA: hypothetical protein VL522_01180 [Bordetella sp.]|jgi:hypothetical protein|nr:hypothetical protein [Bordetella sp.]
MYLHASVSSSSNSLPAIAQDIPRAHDPLTPQPGWIVTYPVGGASINGNGPDAAGTMLNFCVADNITRYEEPLTEALAVISTTTTGQLLLVDLARKLGNRPVSVTRTDRASQAGLTADAQGELYMALYPGTLLSYGARLQPHSGYPQFSLQQQYACGLFEILLCAMNYLQSDTFETGKRIDLHPHTISFQNALLDAARQTAHAAPVAILPDSGEEPVGLRANLNSNMTLYQDGFHRLVMTLRSIEPGRQMLRSLALATPTRSLEVYHVERPCDAGVFLGNNGAIHWYYNVGALAAHAALIQITDDDLTHAQRDACAAFDLLFKSLQSLEDRQAGPGDRLDLDFTRRSFRENLLNDAAGYMPGIHSYQVGDMRV